MKYLPVICLLYMTVAPMATVYASGSMAGPSVEQSLPSITTTGKNPTLRCIIRGSNVSSHVLVWYHQNQTNHIQFLVSHKDKSRPTYGKGITERFLPEIDKSLNAFTLTIGNVKMSDEGLYYCAIWFSNYYIFGEGTELIVQEVKGILRPTLVLFEPSPLEIDLQHTATLLCHAEHYFPKPLRMKWFLNKEMSFDESVNFPAIQNADNTFRQTSALTISGALWKKGVEVTCLLEHESGIQSTSIKSTELTQKGSSQKGLKGRSSGELSQCGQYQDGVQNYDLKILSMAFLVYSILLYISVSYGILLSLYLIQRKVRNSMSISKQIVTTSNDSPGAE